MNEFRNVDDALAFFEGRSEFYPDLDRLLRERIIAAYPPDEDEEDE